MKTTDVYATAVTPRKPAPPAPDNDIEVFIESFKNYDKLVFAVAVLSKFFKWLRDKRYVKPGISQNDLNVAEGSLIRYVQRYAFSDTIEQLNLSGRLSGTQRLFRLEPFLDDDGTIWVYGLYSRLSAQASAQLLLPKSHPLTELIVRHAHSKMTLHSTISDDVLNALQTRFYVRRARKLVDWAIRDCHTCKIIRRREDKRRAPRVR